MDLTFNCPHCGQTLEVDEGAAGANIDCPACGKEITIPTTKSAAPPPPAVAAPVVPTAAPPPAQEQAHGASKHFAVPVRDTPTESLIQKSKPPLEAAAKAASERQLRVKCIRRTECMEVGHDRFDEIVTQFLGKIGESNIVSINTLSYTHVDIGSQKLLTDYGVMIVFRG